MIQRVVNVVEARCAQIFFKYIFLDTAAPVCIKNSETAWCCRAAARLINPYGIHQFGMVSTIRNGGLLRMTRLVLKPESHYPR